MATTLGRTVGLSHKKANRIPATGMEYEDRPVPAGRQKRTPASGKRDDCDIGWEWVLSAGLGAAP
jgi:hypothetical protein